MLTSAAFAQKPVIFSAQHTYRVLVDSFEQQIAFPFYIYNYGDMPLVLHKSRNPRGDCMVSYSHEPILPGDSQLCVFRHNGGKGRAFGETVILENNDSLNSNFHIRFEIDTFGKGPILMMKRTHYYFDTVPEHTVLTKVLVFYNVGDEPLHFTHMAGYGGGEHVRLITESIMPGNSAITRFYYNSGYEGRWMRTIVIRSNDAYEKEFTLKFTGVTSKANEKENLPSD
jgi:hypothetical protein